MIDAPKSCRMHITSGLHAGAEQLLAEGEHTFGSGTDADFVLVDDGLRPLHFKVHLGAHSARIEAFAEPCAVEGVGSLDVGESCDRPLPVAVAVGDCRIEFTSLRAAAKQPGARGQASLLRVMRRHPALAVGGLTTVVVVGSLGAQMPASEKVPLLRPGAAVAVTSPSASSSPPPSAIDALPPRRPPASAPSEVAALPPSPPPSRPAAAPAAPGGGAVERERERVAPSRQAAGEAAKALKQDIEKAGLLNIVLEPGAGVVAASGTIEPDAATQWLTLQQQFDERYLGEITLINGVTLKAEKLPALDIQAVWRGANPHLVIRGQKYPVGAVLDNGWAVKRIDLDRVLLERQGRLVALRY